VYESIQSGRPQTTAAQNTAKKRYEPEKRMNQKPLSRARAVPLHSNITAPPSSIGRSASVDRQRRLPVAFLLLAAACVPSVRAQQSPFANYLPTITTLAGSGVNGVTTNGTPANNAKFANPASVGWDAAGNLYILDKNKDVVLEVTASNNSVNTIIGVSGTAGYVDGVPGTSANLSTPSAIAVDNAGNVYIADTKNNRIREWTASNGIINSVAGNGAATYSGNGGPALSAGINGPTAVSVDAYGNLYIADAGDDLLRVVYVGGPVSAVPGLAAAAAALTPSTPQAGHIYTIVGVNGVNTSTGNGSPALAATISGPVFGSLDSHNNLYLTDKTHDVIRRVIADTDIINTIAGNGTAGSNGDGGLATSAALTMPDATRQDLQGNVFLVDSGNNVLRVVDPQTQSIYTIAGQIGETAASFAGDGDGGFATAGSFSGPSDVSLSPSGQIAIADSGLHVVRGVTPPATNFATTGVASASSAFAYTLGAVKADTFTGISIQDKAADFTIASTGCTLPAVVTAGTTTCVPNVTFTPTAPGLRTAQLVTKDAAAGQAILQLTGVGNAAAVTVAPGIISTIAGTPGTAGSTGDGTAGNLYAAGADNKVRIISPTGIINTFAGTGTAGFSGDFGPATAALLNKPTAVAMAPNGDIAIADTGNNTVRIVGAASGVIRSVTLPGMLSTPKGVAFDVTGNLYIADTGNNVIREVSRYANFYSTLAGTAGTAGKTGDGGAATAALLSAPSGIALDAGGNLYIADTGNNEVRKITVATGVITTVAGNGTQGNSGDGAAATSATLNMPSQVAVDAAGDIYIACAGSSSIRRVSAATGTISTIAGTGTAGTGGDGGLATSGSLSGPLGLALDGKNNLYIADTANQRIAEVPGSTSTLTFPATLDGRISAAQTVTITNFGNQTLTLGALSLTSNYSQTASGGADCSPTTTLAAGASCLISIVFSPVTPGTVSGTLTLTDNALGLSAATQVITLTGTAQVNTAVPASIGATGGNNQTVSPYAPFPANLQATVLDKSAFGVANAAVTFTAPSSGATGTFSNGTNTITVLSGGGGVASAPFTALGTRGTFNITATVTGATSPATFTETIAGTLLPKSSFAYSPAANPAAYGETLTLTVNLTPPAGTTTIGGMVTFSDNGTAIHTANVSNGVATYSYVPAASGHSFTFTYSGDSNYSPTASTTPLALTITPLPITAAAGTVTFPFGTPTLPQLAGQLTGVLPADAGNVTLSLSTTPAYSNVLPAGVYNISGSISGTAAGNYQLTSTTGTVTVTPAPVTIALTTSNPYPGTSTPLTFTATVVSLVTGTTTSNTAADPAATVTFYDGTIALGSASTVANGVATFIATLSTLGTHVITAVSVPGNYSGTSNAVTEAVSAPAITLFTDASKYTVVQGQKADVLLSTLAGGGISTAITYACSGLPANSSCIITPLSFTPTPAGAAAIYGATGEVQIDTAGPGLLSARMEAPRGGANRIQLAGMILPVCLLAGWFGRKRRRGRQALVLQSLLLALFGLALSQTIGCGSTTTAAQAVYTPAGTSTVTITATSGTVTGSTSITLVVTPKP
jgi:sugar lactone lactonase YvrE